MTITPTNITSKDKLNLTIIVKPQDIYKTTITTGNITLYEDNVDIKTVLVTNQTTIIEYTPHTGKYNLITAYKDLTNSYTTTNNIIPVIIPK